MCILLVYADENPQGPDNAGPQKGDVFRVLEDTDPFEAPSPTRRRKLRVVRMPGVPAAEYRRFAQQEMQMIAVPYRQQDGSTQMFETAFPTARKRAFKLDISKDATLGGTVDETDRDDTVDATRADKMLVNKSTRETEEDRKKREGGR